jgi:phosphatidyl-myo-inositol dimannoside synthase
MARQSSTSRGRGSYLPSESNDVADRVLLLTPSNGRGGGIERYVDTVEWAFGQEGVSCHRIDLRSPGLWAHARMLVEATRYLRSRDCQVRLVLAHPCLLPVAMALAQVRPVAGTTVVCHGSEVWGRLLRPRRFVERQLMSVSTVRVVAVSNFTSGVLSAVSPAAILAPGLSREWFDKLVKASADEVVREPGFDLVTAFRLADWRDKGLLQLLDAVEALGRPNVRLTICGSGEASPDLRRLVERYKHCTIRVGLSDSDLASQLAMADLFVLATRTRRGRSAYGEGFGLVLLEAQLAGTPVVGPAFGGSHDAYVDGVTGASPTDESAEALAKVLDKLLGSPLELAEMGRRASVWARDCFEPERHAQRVITRLL